MSVAATPATAGFSLASIDVAWLGPDPLQTDRERWRLRLTFAPRMTPDGPVAPLPPVGPSDAMLIATDGGAPAAVVAVHQPRGDAPWVDLTVVKLSEPQVNSQGRWFRLALAAPGLAAEGAAALFALGPGGPPTPRVPEPAPPVRPTSISYLARDYPAFVTILQAALRLLDPQWQDISAGDVGVTLTEVLAYAADNLSYYQDAVATEAYLGTARRRLSVGRHARQLGYSLREGCNARAWVQLQVMRPMDLPAGTPFLAGVDLPSALAADSTEHQAALQAGAMVFEALEAARLDPSLNGLSLYDWGQDTFTLRQGAQAAVFRDAWTAPAVAGKPRPRFLDALAAGQVVLFERGGGESRQPFERWPVRLQRLERLVLPSADVPDGIPVVSAAWADADALPFDLPVSALRHGRKQTDLSVVSGNLVAADQGRTVHAALPPASDLAPYRPPLPAGSLVYAAPATLAPDAPASAFLQVDPNAALAAIRLVEQRLAYPPADRKPPPVPPPPPVDGAPEPARGDLGWQVRADLLSSGPFARDFVVEADNDRTLLRFGDSVFGRAPDACSAFTAVFRIGDMSAGGVAREAIATLVAPDARRAAVWREALVVVRNPIAATGPAAPDPVNLARRLAAVGVRPGSLATLADYAAAAREFRDVDQAAAELETTGAWPLIVVYIRRRYGRLIDQAFRAQLEASLQDRLIGGRRFEARPARAVGLDIVMGVTLASSAFHDQAALDLQAAFSPIDGFFCLDNWPLGETLYASAMIARAMQVKGVLEARVIQLDRMDRRQARGAPPVMATFGPHEYPSVDNTGAARYGRITFLLGDPQ